MAERTPADEIYDSFGLTQAQRRLANIMAFQREENERLEAERKREDEERRARALAAQPRLHAALKALDEISEPLSRKVLDLHSRDGSRYFECQGCDPGSYATDLAEWPCATVELIAEHHGIDIDDFHFYDPDWTPND